MCAVIAIQTFTATPHEFNQVRSSSSLCSTLQKRPLTADMTRAFHYSQWKQLRAKWKTNTASAIAHTPLRHNFGGCLSVPVSGVSTVRHAPPVCSFGDFQGRNDIFPFSLVPFIGPINVFSPVVCQVRRECASIREIVTTRKY